MFFLDYNLLLQVAQLVFGDVLPESSDELLELLLHYFVLHESALSLGPDL